jgi:hypothetical protein
VPRAPKKHDSKAQEEATSLAYAKLRLSGLDPEDFAALNMRALTGDATQALHDGFRPSPSLLIPYFDVRGGPLASAPKHPQFYRLRYLARLTDFDSITGRKTTRYVQEPGSGVCAYFPTSLDWKPIVADPSTRLFVTEGELKAAKACREGFPTVGLGGVYNYRAAKYGVTFLPELEAVDWVRRHVYVVYDSDYRTNAQVCRALYEFAELIRDRGAYPYLISLPELRADEKTGLDDFLTLESGAAFRRLVTQGEPLTLAKPLWQLNDRVVYVRNPGLIMETRTGQKLSPTIFRDAAYAPESYSERVLKADGSVSLKRTSAAAAWLKWPLRFEVDALTYAPGRPRIVETGRRVKYNTWSGWGAEPRKGNVEPFTQLVDHLFTGSEPEAKRWFLDWAAYPLRYPGTKLFTSAVVFGVRHGTGKSLLGLTLGRIYGRNFTEINRADLHASFNDWAENKQFVLGDDVMGSNRRTDADLLKKMITQKELRLNPKYVPSFVVPDCINFFFTSNHPDAFFLEDDDRRFFVHEVTVDPLPEEFYAAYDLWLAADGPAAIFAYLKARKLRGFNPNAPALRTAAKARMIADVKSDLGGWVERLRLDSDAVLRIGSIRLESDLFTNAQLLALYDPTGETRTTANGIGRELKRAGFVQVLAGRPVRTNEGLNRFYAIRNAAKWATASAAAIVAHVHATHGAIDASRKF